MISVRNPELFRKYFGPTIPKYDNCIVVMQDNGYWVECEEHKEPWEQRNPRCEGLALADSYWCNHMWAEWRILNDLRNGNTYAKK